MNALKCLTLALMLKTGGYFYRTSANLGSTCTINLSILLVKKLPDNYKSDNKRRSTKSSSRSMEESTPPSTPTSTSHQASSSTDTSTGLLTVKVEVYQSRILPLSTNINWKWNILQDVQDLPPRDYSSTRDPFVSAIFDEFSSFWCPSQNFADRGWEPSKEYFNIWLCMIQKEYLIFNYPNFNCIFKSFTLSFIFSYLLWHSAKQSSIFAPLHMEMFIPQSLFLFNPLNPRSWLLPTTNTSELLFVNSKYFAILCLYYSLMYSISETD